MMKQATFGAVIIALILLATAGAVGYALSIQSQTTFDENEMDGEYIYITSTDYTDFLGTVSFDTVNDHGTASYVIHSDTAYGALASEEFTINVARSSDKVGNLYDLEVTVTEFIPVTGLTYTVTAGTDTNKFLFVDSTYENISGQPTTYKWTLTNLYYGENYIFALYVDGTPSVDPGATLGFTNVDSTANPAVVGSVFTLTAIDVIEP